jgi:prolyl-tRNA synthetase
MQVRKLLTEVHDRILEKAEESLKTHLVTAATPDECREKLEGNVVAVHWCGSRECADRLEELTGAGFLGTGVRSRYIPDDEGACVICGQKGRTALIGKSY